MATLEAIAKILLWRWAQHLLRPGGLTHGGSILADHISSVPLQLRVYLKSDNPQSFDTGVPE
jgi:hypothetical protein